MSSQLSPLPECVVAAMTLRELGVHVDIPVGWAPTGLALATAMFALRPGVKLSLHSADGHLQWWKDGGVWPGGTTDTEEQAMVFFVAFAAAARTCGACGRPGRRRSEPAGVWCDVCGYLAVTPSVRELPHSPRLPLPDETLEALAGLASLPDPMRFITIPVGWARLARSTLRDITCAEVADQVGFDIHDDTVSLTAPDGLWTSELDELNARLEVNARIRCRFCSRPVDANSMAAHAGACDGCWYVQSRGSEVVETVEDGPR